MSAKTTSGTTSLCTTRLSALCAPTTLPALRFIVAFSATERIEEFTRMLHSVFPTTVRFCFPLLTRKRSSKHSCRSWIKWCSRAWLYFPTSTSLSTRITTKRMNAERRAGHETRRQGQDVAHSFRRGRQVARQTSLSGHRGEMPGTRYCRSNRVLRYRRIRRQHADTPRPPAPIFRSPHHGLRRRYAREHRQAPACVGSYGGRRPDRHVRGGGNQVRASGGVSLSGNIKPSRKYMLSEKPGPTCSIAPSCEDERR